MFLPVPEINTCFFSANHASKMLVCEHSDLRNVNIFHRLYDDACDVGIALYNPTTRKSTRWYLQTQQRDNEGDLQVTIYAPCPESLLREPQLKGWTVHILND